MKLLLYGLLMVLAMNGVDKCDPEMEGQAVNLDETFELELDKAVVIKGEKLGITFSKKQEGRCPLEVNCIQAGVGRATFQLTNSNGTETLVLEAKGLCHKVDGSCGEMKTAMGYSIKLVTLNPYPGSDAANNKEPAKASLVVSKN